MKKTILTGMLMIFTISFGFAQNNTDVLPQSSQDFISENFSSETVESAKKENSWFNWDKNEMYEVEFSNGIKLDFNKAGEVTEIDSKNEEPIPSEVLPRQIRTYVENNYQDAQIVSWEKDDDDQEAQLADGTELEFDGNGNFLKED